MTPLCRSSDIALVYTWYIYTYRTALKQETGTKTNVHPQESPPPPRQKKKGLLPSASDNTTYIYIYRARKNMLKQPQPLLETLSYRVGVNVFPGT